MPSTWRDCGSNPSQCIEIESVLHLDLKPPLLGKRKQLFFQEQKSSEQQDVELFLPQRRLGL